jgi:hypothetical protein
MASDTRMGLYDLVAQARDCWAGRVAVLEQQEDTVPVGFRSALNDGDRRVKDSIDDAVEEVLQNAAVGWFGPPLTPSAAIDDILNEVPCWVDFCAVCDLAARIDGLLDVLQSDGVALAPACRDDLDALSVLADWCDDAGRPAAAAELRHLHKLFRHFRAALRAGPMPLEVWVEETVMYDLE